MPTKREPVLLHARQLKVNRVMWAILIAFLLIDLLLVKYQGLQLYIPSLAGFLFFMLVCAALSLFYRTVRRDDTLYLLGSVINQCICASFIVSTTSYLGARLNLPLTDDALIAIDHALKFDWLSYVQRINTQPLLAKIFTSSYVSASLQYALISFMLFYAESLHAQRVLIMFFLTGMLTIIIASLLPAVGGYIYYHVDMASLPNLHPAAARVHESLLLGLRDHSATALPFVGPGIVTFPSFHTTMGVLLIYASLPFRKPLWLLLVPLNVMMIVSTPVDGGHYLIDVIGGLAMAAFGIWFAEKILPRNA